MDKSFLARVVPQSGWAVVDLEAAPSASSWPPRAQVLGFVSGGAGQSAVGMVMHYVPGRNLARVREAREQACTELGGGGG